MPTSAILSCDNQNSATIGPQSVPILSSALPQENLTVGAKTHKTQGRIQDFGKGGGGGPGNC